MKTKKTILLVDDDHTLLMALKARCVQLGLEVQVAHNALTAVQLMDKSLPDLVCLDVNLPTGNGLAICETMAGDPVTARIPVIILTGRQDPETINKCRDLCAYYVQKSGDLWRRLEPVIFELIDIEPLPSRQVTRDSSEA